MTLGLIGMGRIGRAVAVRARAFRMDLVAFDTVVDAEFDREHGIRRLPLDELLACSDVVSLHVPLTEATRGMVNRDFLAPDAARLVPDQHRRAAAWSSRPTSATPWSRAIWPAPAWTSSTTSPPSRATRCWACPNVDPQPAHRRHRPPVDARDGRDGRRHDRRALPQPVARPTASSTRSCATAGRGRPAPAPSLFERSSSWQPLKKCRRRTTQEKRRGSRPARTGPLRPTRAGPAPRPLDPAAPSACIVAAAASKRPGAFEDAQDAHSQRWASWASPHELPGRGEGLG